MDPRASTVKKKRFLFWFQYYSRSEDEEKNQSHSTVSKNINILVSVYCTTYCMRFGNIQWSLDLHRKKCFFPDYSTTMMHGTWKNSIRLDPRRKKILATVLLWYMRIILYSIGAISQLMICRPPPLRSGYRRKFLQRVA